MELKWSELLSVGNELIDSDHKNMIVVANRVRGAIKVRDRVAMSKAFELFDAYMRIHLQHEERVAAAIDYPFAQDKLALQQLMDEMRYMIKKLAGTNDDWPDTIMDMYFRFLSGWLNEHIVKTNMRMKPALQNFPYDFTPFQENARMFV